MDVEYAAALGATAATCNAACEFGVIDLHQHDACQRLTDLGQQLLERRRLHQVARKAIKDKTLGSIRLSKALANNAQHDRVIDQLAGLHDLAGHDTQRRAARHGRAQQIAGGYLRNAEACYEPL